VSVAPERDGSIRFYSPAMAVTPESRRWDSLFAQRTRGDVGEGIAAVLAFLGLPNLISFAGGFPDPLTFPRERASALLAEFAAAGEAQAFQYAPTRGLAGPLDALAGRIETLQGRRPGDDELLITSGGMEALELVGKSFLDRGDLVVVEAPTYLGAIMAFRSFEAEVVAVPVDEHGLEVDELERRLVAGLRPKLLYVIPDHQNPAGVSLSAERRAALVELARRHGFLIVEDVAYRELGFDDHPPASLWSSAPDTVVQAGTTSKTLFPGFRLGWAVGPAEISDRLVAAKQNTDQCSGGLGQRIFEEYVRRGWIDEQLAKSRALYRSKCERLLAALERTMPEGVEWTRAGGGFFSWLTLPGVDATALTITAAEHGVGIVPGTMFYPDGRGGENIRLAFSMVDEPLIDEGVERLAALL
jgi:2-aminoadipate transaminase